MINQQIARIFNRIADLLEIKGENPFRVRAYRNAARTIESLGKNLQEMVEQKQDLTSLPGIGKDLAGKINEIVETGNLSKLEELEKRVPPGLVELLKVEGLGPKRIKVLHDKLGITRLEELRDAASQNRIRELPGFGKKLEDLILKGVVLAKKEGRRFRWSLAESYVTEILDHLKKAPGLKNVQVAGSFRRKKETVGDLDILVTASEPGKVIEHFVRFPGIKNVISQGRTRSTVILSSDLQIDLRAVEKESYGSALHYFTGSKAHNIAIRTIAQKAGLKINEYGIFKRDRRIAGREEADIFKAVGLTFIEPELRENRGEIQAARAGRLPHLITLKDIRGDLHMHTTWSDGRYSVEEMAEAARALGYSYIAITDHSKRMTITKGLDDRRLLAQGDEIDRVRRNIRDITVLKGIEVDILEDGSLDLSDEALSTLDIVLAAVHSKFKLSREKQTRRIMRALDNPYVNVIAHPTGRLLGEREAYQVDMERVMEKALERGCFLELNSQPARLDLNDVNLKMARDMGVRIAISTDSHNTDSLRFMRYGINQARRGWLEPQDVINARPLDKLLKLLRPREH